MHPFRLTVPPPHRLTAAAALAALLAWLAPPAAAQNVFQFGTDPSDPKVGLTPSLELRPNSEQVWYLYVANPTNDAQDLRVELVMPGGAKAQADVRGAPAKANNQLQYVRVKLQVPAEKPAPPPAAPPVAAPAPGAPAGTPPAAAPPAEAPPKGAELKPDRGQITFTLNLYQLPLPEKGAKPLATQRVTVNLLRPADYLQTPTAQFRVQGAHEALALTVKAGPRLQGPSCPVTLTFPPQPSLDVRALKAGNYRSNLPPGGSATLTAEDLPIAAKGDAEGRFYVGADGLPRAFLFTPRWGALRGPAINPNSARSEVRGYPGVLPGPVPKRLAAAPSDRFPVRIEVDNPPPGARLQLALDRDGNNNFDPNSDEIKDLFSAYDQGVWLDPSEEKGQGLLFTTRVHDRVEYLDTRGLRGPHRLRVSLFGEGASGEMAFSETLLVIDDTPPTVDLGPLPDRQVRTRPMPVSAVASDAETNVVRVLFIFGELSTDGKLPAGAPVAEGLLAKDGTWRAMLPLPPDVKPGPAFITVVAENEVGLKSATPPKPIVLVEAPTTGIIEGRVLLGDRPQPEASVQLFDANKKEVGGAITDAKGVYRIEGVPPGGYRVVGFKPDSGDGTKGATKVMVKAGDKPSVADIALSRRPLPP